MGRQPITARLTRPNSSNRQPPPGRTAGISTAPRRYSLSLFFLLAFTLSWAVWLPATVTSFLRANPTPGSSGTALIGSFGPLAAALITAGFMDGRIGFRELGRRLVTWRVRTRWYAFVLLWPAAHSLAATGASVLLGSEAPQFDRPPFLEAYPLPDELTTAVPLLAFLPLVFLQQLLLGSSIGEEPGWRGYALPRMQWAHSSLAASLALGLLWAFWHLPLWLRPDHPASQIGWDVLELIAVAVLFTWVFNHTRGSLFVALLFHASTAVTGLFLASSRFHPTIDVVLVWILVAIVVVSEPELRTKRKDGKPFRPESIG